ncbi:Heterogeneous nuclear ribonucleoprotein L-like, partial [Galemys pyrenaicus]
ALPPHSPGSWARGPRGRLGGADLRGGGAAHGGDWPASSEARAPPPPPPACPPVPPAAAMSSSSSSPRETYEEDREYESQAKRLKTEEGEIDYSAEEGENRREATPRGGGDGGGGGGGGGGRSFSQPVTKRGAPSTVRQVEVIIKFLFHLLYMFEDSVNLWWKPTFYVMMMPFKRQALVEFENIDSAKECVTFAADEPVYIAGQQAFFNYSTSKRITRPGNTDDPSGGNKVLLLSIQNPLYPITVPTRLNVIRNDNDSWDYTKPYLGRRDRGKGRQRQAILGEHPSSFRHDGYGSHGPLLPLPSRYRMGSRDTPELVAYPLPQASSSYMHGGNPSGSVVMVSGLHQLKMNCSRVFNLFCLYGNIEKVKFMKTIPGTALVEMGDDVSKQHSVVPSQIFELEDGTSSYKDFAMSKNNRFTSAGQASKNIIQPPSCVLHYYNVPLCVTEETFTKLCNDHEVLTFIKYKVFDAKPSAKTLSGLLEWECKTDAVEALTALNHYQIRVP